MSIIRSLKRNILRAKGDDPALASTVVLARMQRAKAEAKRERTRREAEAAADIKAIIAKNDEEAAAKNLVLAAPGTIHRTPSGRVSTTALPVEDLAQQALPLTQKDAPASP